MASAYIRCPHCNSLLCKGPLLKVVNEHGGVVYGPETEPCGECGHPIKLKAIMEGTYDAQDKERRGSGCGCLGLLILVAIVLASQGYCR